MYIVAPFSIYFPPPVGPFFSPPWCQRLPFSSPIACYVRRIRVICSLFQWLLRFFLLYFILVVVDFIILLSTPVFHCVIVLMRGKILFLSFFQCFSLVIYSFCSLFSFFSLNFFRPALNFFPPALYFLPHPLYPAAGGRGEMQQYTSLDTKKNCIAKLLSHIIF